MNIMKYIIDSKFLVRRLDIKPYSNFNVYEPKNGVITFYLILITLLCKELNCYKSYRAYLYITLIATYGDTLLYCKYGLLLTFL